MPRREDIQSVLIIGAGPIIIGQACEFDYSGTQACKALKEEGYRVILVNSNPATIMTDPETADAVYIEPVHWSAVAKIIAKEAPDTVLYFGEHLNIVVLVIKPVFETRKLVDEGFPNIVRFCVHSARQMPCS